MTLISSELSFRDLSVPNKIRTAIVGTTTLTLMLVIIVYTVFEWYAVRQNLVRELEIRADIVSSNSLAALTFNDPRSATETLQALKAASEIEMACIYKNLSEGQVSKFASYTSGAKNGDDCPSEPDSDSVVFELDMISLSHQILFDNETLGVLYLEANLSQLWSRLGLMLQVSGVILLISVALAVFLANILQRLISTPVIDLSNLTKRVSETRDYTLRARKKSNDEIGNLISGFNDMLEQIAIRDEQLLKAGSELEQQVEKSRRANRELETTLRRLEKTQDQLVQTEKMASLGGLVAGVAHEINTPVGIGVTAASTLKAKSQDLKMAYQDGKISRSMLDDYIDTANQISDMILTNLNRAAELIQSFKQVAVDQSSSESRKFRLREYLDEVLLSLRPKLKNTPHKVELHCPDDLYLETYPGAISQVITNLVMNSLTHAFDENQAGLLKLEVKPQDTSVLIVYSDDGKGIPAGNMDKVFDPFFTTKRGSGGSGLGMHVVYNLVTATLGGTIRLDKDIKKGFRVEIRIPIKAGK